MALTKVINDLHLAKFKVISLVSSFSISQHHLTQLTTSILFETLARTLQSLDFPPISLAAPSFLPALWGPLEYFFPYLNFLWKCNASDSQIFISSL